MNDKAIMIYRIDGENGVRSQNGRDAWALAELLRAGKKGCTPINNPAPRWSAYIHNLRKDGLSIETITENHGGQFQGTHARYVLHTPLEIRMSKGVNIGETA